ncbi:MAG TPA: hypothetical protein VK875_09435 [Euzebyales bacterium]|nr:hypothetical protein [Euzebyales bacterium]
MASAGDNPLSDVPPEFEPAVDAAAGELGVSADELKSASKEELQKLLCGKLEGESSADIAARVQQALDDAPKEQLKGLSEGELAQIKTQIPLLISQLKEACAEREDVADTDDASDDTDVPTPERVDAGAGGLTNADGMVPVAFGGAFALLFGLFGFAIVRMRRGDA